MFYPKVIAITALILIGFLIYWDASAWLSKIFLMDKVLKRDGYTADTYIASAKELLDFHPEIREDTSALTIYRGVKNVYLTNPKKSEKDVRKIMLALEGYAPENPYIYVNIGRIYFLLLRNSESLDDYLKAVNYYKKALKLMPDNPFALYDLHCLYLMGSEPEEAVLIRDRIERNWGKMTKEQICSII